jgi:hypothetical protein
MEEASTCWRRWCCCSVACSTRRSPHTHTHADPPAHRPQTVHPSDHNRAPLPHHPPGRPSIWLYGGTSAMPMSGRRSFALRLRVGLSGNRRMMRKTRGAFSVRSGGSRRTRRRRPLVPPPPLLLLPRLPERRRWRREREGRMSSVLWHRWRRRHHQQQWRQRPRRLQQQRRRRRSLCQKGQRRKTKGRASRRQAKLHWLRAWCWWWPLRA